MRFAVRRAYAIALTKELGFEIFGVTGNYRHREFDAD